MQRKILLIEPNYKNKFPPVGLMKISTYHKLLGDDVVFFKGDIKEFIIDRIVNQCVEKLNKLEGEYEWKYFYDTIKEYIKTRRNVCLEKLPLESLDSKRLLVSWLEYFKDYYWKKDYLLYPEWDRIYVTTLFTFYFDITVNTINQVKGLVKKDGVLNVGGVLASLQPEEIEKATGIKPHQGLLYHLDEGNDYIVDSLPLDYTILDEVDYKYEMSNAYYAYTTRGCIRKCKFCAVPKLEPHYIDYIPLKERIMRVNEICGERANLLLMDNNILASKQFDRIIQEIIDCGFGKGSKYQAPDELAISIRNLEDSINDRAYVRKTQSLLFEFYRSIKDPDMSFKVFSILEDNKVLKYSTSTKKNLLKAYDEIAPFYKASYKSKKSGNGKMKVVDFNQGVDARLFTPHIVDQLSKIAIRPLRIAFDNIKTTDQYVKALRMSADAGIKEFSNYLLYNFDDKPEDLYQRLRINVELCEELGVNIYSFPMKYHPVFGEYSHNRDYIGVYWNKKYIRAVQAILNCTKGQIGRGKSFFYKAFGKDESEYNELLEMPESFILYRYFFEWLNDRYEICTKNWRKCWMKCESTMSDDDWKALLDYIHKDEFGIDSLSQFSDPHVLELLKYYKNFRSDIITKGTKLYELKQEYDSNPIMISRRH
jgi:hypothetical protein